MGYISVNQDRLRFKYYLNSYNVIVTYQDVYVKEISGMADCPEWIETGYDEGYCINQSYDDNMIGMSQYDYKFPATYNFSRNTRYDSITFTEYDAEGNEISCYLSIEQEGNPLESEITTNVQSISMDGEGGTATVVVDYTNPYTINDPVAANDWVTSSISSMDMDTVNIEYGRTGTTTVVYTINIGENKSNSSRTNVLTFSIIDAHGELMQKTINISQARATQSYIQSSPTSISASNIETTGTFDVYFHDFHSISNVTMDENISWLTITQSQAVSHNTEGFIYRYSYRIAENTSTESRNGNIIFRGAGLDGKYRTLTINVYQAAAPEYADNYIGYFMSLDGVKYTVKLIGDETSDTYKEIKMSAESPFLVNYQSSDILFEPIKKSTATIKIVHNTYLENILSPYSQGTKVELIAENKKKWVGFLTPKVYDQSWVTEWEEIELEASDCISALQYLDYEAMNDKGFVTFKDILKMIVEKTQLIKGYYWPQSKIVDDAYLTPEKIGVYEKNFFSNDTDEPWKLYDVLSEICQYLGLTCVQSFDELWFLDYGDYLTQTPTNSKYDYYTPSQIYRSYDYLGKYTPVITSEIFRGNDGSISFQPIYNKVTVKDNMYNVEDVFPNIFDDKYLTNINGDFFAAVEVEPLSEYASYPYGSSWFSQKYVNEEVADTAYRYFMRIYEHKYWQTVYNGNITLMGGDAVQSLRDILQGRLVDLGTVKETYYSYGQKIMPNTVDYKRYICIPTKHNDTTQNTGKVVYKLKDGWRMPCMVSNDSFLVFQNSVLWERYNGRPYINPDWTNKPNKIYLGMGGSSWDRIAWPMYRLTIGDKAWSGFHKKWVALDNARNYFEPVMEWQQDNMNYWNTEIDCLNQVSWEENIKEAGYVIPLKDVDLSQPIHFEILCPAPSNYARDDDNNYMMMKYNAYCWISDLSVKIVERGQDVDKQDNDVVYENIIDENSMCEYNEVDFKLTTYSEYTKPSYSHVVYINGDKKEFLLTIKDRGLTSAEQNAEENFIERIVNQYSTPTQQLSITVSDKYDGGFTYNSIISPFKYNDAIYFPMGTEIDYAASREKITLIETK